MLRPALIIFGALPFIALVLASVEAPASALRLFEPWFDAHCHRDPHRTLAILGQRFPVCARCTGLYAGLLGGAALVGPKVGARLLAAATLVAGTVLVLDVLTEAAGWRVPSLGTRFVTGFLFAYPAAVAAVAGARSGFGRSCRAGSP